MSDDSSDENDGWQRYETRRSGHSSTGNKWEIPWEIERARSREMERAREKDNDVKSRRHHRRED